MMSESQPSIASLTQEISVLAEAKQQWETETSDALLGSIQALQDYASVLRTTLSQVEATASLLQENYTHRTKALFDEPMDKLRRNMQAMRDEYERMLRDDIIPVTLPLEQVIHERVPGMCVLFETYAAVNGERMRLPPDVTEGTIPMVMVGRKKLRVFHREITMNDFLKLQYFSGLPYKVRKFELPGISDQDLSNILRQHNWCVMPHPSGICGCAHYYDDAGRQGYFLFTRLFTAPDIRLVDFLRPF